MNGRGRQHGWTLLELVLVLVVVAVIAMVGARGIGVGIDSFSVAREAGERERDVGVAVEQILRDIRISVERAEVDDDLLVLCFADGECVSYCLLGDELRRDGSNDGGCNGEPLVTRVVDGGFQEADPPERRVAVELQVDGLGGTFRAIGFPRVAEEGSEE